MLEQTLRAVAFALIACLLSTGCSSFSSRERGRVAYARYVRKASHNRVKQQTKFKTIKIPTFSPSDNVVRSSIMGPQSVTAGASGQ